MATAIANRYARALADVIARTGNYTQALGELRSFAAVYDASAELREVLQTPAIALPDKRRVLEAILARLGTSGTIANFFRVLLGNFRLRALDEIIDAFVKIVNDRTGVAQVRISSAAELSSEEKQSLTARFATLTRRKVEADFDVIPELLGGVTAQIGSTVYDGSVRGHLQRIRERLTAR